MKLYNSLNTSLMIRRELRLREVGSLWEDDDQVEKSC
jgi:hypothetical protein